jgi:protein-disulfide isomerase
MFRGQAMNRKISFGLAMVCGLISLAAGYGQTGAEKLADLLLAGQANAGVRIEVFSDYQCPMCKAFYLETIKPLIADYTQANKINKISITYHDFPLDMHQYARKAARFAMAALRLGRDRWLRVNDALYMEQEKWSQDGNIEAVLAKVLDPAEVARIKSLASNPAIEAAINEEVQLGISKKIDSTPTLFIASQTGKQLRATGMINLPTLKSQLDRLIN